MKASTISFEVYKAAADRIRRGKERQEDNAICDQWDAQVITKSKEIINSVFDLPIARYMWKMDAKDLTRY